MCENAAWPEIKGCAGAVKQQRNQERQKAVNNVYEGYTERAAIAIKRLHRLQDGGRPATSEHEMLLAELRSERDQHMPAKQQVIDSWIKWLEARVQVRHV